MDNDLHQYQIKQILFNDQRMNDRYLKGFNDCSYDFLLKNFIFNKELVKDVFPIVKDVKNNEPLMIIQMIKIPTSFKDNDEENEQKTQKLLSQKLIYVTPRGVYQSLRKPLDPKCPLYDVQIGRQQGRLTDGKMNDILLNPQDKCISRYQFRIIYKFCLTKEVERTALTYLYGVSNKYQQKSILTVLPETTKRIIYDFVYPKRIPYLEDNGSFLGTFVKVRSSKQDAIPLKVDEFFQIDYKKGFVVVSIQNRLKDLLDQITLNQKQFFPMIKNRLTDNIKLFYNGYELQNKDQINYFQENSCLLLMFINDEEEMNTECEKFLLIGHRYESMIVNNNNNAKNNFSERNNNNNNSKCIDPMIYQFGRKYKQMDIKTEFCCFEIYCDQNLQFYVRDISHKYPVLNNFGLWHCISQYKYSKIRYNPRQYPVKYGDIVRVSNQQMKIIWNKDPQKLLQDL